MVYSISAIKKTRPHPFETTELRVLVWSFPESFLNFMSPVSMLPMFTSTAQAHKAHIQTAASDFIDGALHADSQLAKNPLTWLDQWNGMTARWNQFLLLNIHETFYFFKCTALFVRCNNWSNYDVIILWKLPFPVICPFTATLLIKQTHWCTFASGHSAIKPSDKPRAPSGCYEMHLTGDSTFFITLLSAGVKAVCDKNVPKRATLTWGTIRKPIRQ